MDKTRKSDDVTRRDANEKGRDSNPDPITGAPGSHPVGTGVGAAAGGAAGAAAGAAIGAAAGSVVPGAGTVVGGVIGAVAGAVGGGYAGKGVAEKIDPTVEDAYWRNEHRNRPYYDASLDYDVDYAPAYRYGVSSYSQYHDRDWSDVESDLSTGWDKSRGQSQMSWEKAKDATRDAWSRLKDNTSRNTGTRSSSTHGR